MYFKDLDLCCYHRGPYDADEWRCPLQAVGWLEHPHEFATGDISKEILTTLEGMITSSRTLYPQYVFRGLHDCTLCPARGFAPGQFILSHVNIFVPGDRVVYLAPGLITHYVGGHRYLPPAGFIEAVMKCPEYGSQAYCEALRVANGDHRPPLLTKEEDHAEWMLQYQKIAAWKKARGESP